MEYVWTERYELTDVSSAINVCGDDRFGEGRFVASFDVTIVHSEGKSRILDMLSFFALGLPPATHSPLLFNYFPVNLMYLQCVGDLSIEFGSTIPENANEGRVPFSFVYTRFISTTPRWTQP